MLASSMPSVQLPFTYDRGRVVAFMRRYLPGIEHGERAVAIGLERAGELAAGVLFDGLNPVNVWMHVAAVPGARWMTRAYLQAAFAYPFEVCKVQRVSGYVDASNTAARRFNEHLGFREEAVLRGAAVDGGDVLIYVMWRHQCRFII
jgi:RimJ/RimL family protein N-acetyltransferase